MFGAGLGLPREVSRFVDEEVSYSIQQQSEHSFFSYVVQ